MLIAQLSDTHLNFNAGDFGFSVLEQAVQQIKKLPKQPDVLLLTGDLVDHGLEEGYQRLKSILEPLTMPYYVIPGNHDDRDQMVKHFGEQGQKGLPGFVQYTVEDFPVRLIALDTIIPGEINGLLCQQRLTWLRERLVEAPDQPTLIMMHHPPGKLALDVLDGLAIKNPDDFVEIVRQHAQIELIVAGHIHMALTRRVAGTVLMTCPSPKNCWLPNLKTPQRLDVELQPTLYYLHHWKPETGLFSYTGQMGEFPNQLIHDGEAWVK